MGLTAVQFPAQTGSEAHLTSYPTGAGALTPW